MQVHTKDWGLLEVPEERLVQMANGPLGFEDLHRFVLIEQAELRPFLWLQSVDDPETGFAVAEPHFFHAGPYPLTLSEIDEAMLDLAEGDTVTIFAIVTLQPDGEAAANLKGPIVLNPRNRLARQVVVYGSALSVRQPMLRRPPVPLPLGAGEAPEGA